MNLKIQIYSLVFSFIYGLIFYLLVLINKKYLYNNKFAFVMDFLFIIDNVLLYFIILKYINNGIFHIYFFITIILGYLLGSFVDKKRLR